MITLQDRKEEGTLIRLESLYTASTPISQPLELASQHPKHPIPKDTSCSSMCARAGAAQLLVAVPGWMQDASKPRSQCLEVWKST